MRKGKGKRAVGAYAGVASTVVVTARLHCSTVEEMKRIAGVAGVKWGVVLRAVVKAGMKDHPFKSLARGK